MNFEEQNKVKHSQLRDALLRESPEDIKALDDTIVSGAEFKYRNKVCFHAHRVGKLLDVGYVKSDNVSVFDVEKCLLLADDIQNEYDKIRENISVMHSFRDGMEITLRYESGKNQVHFWRNSPDKHATWLREKLSCGMFSVPLGNFFQVNNEIADKLLETAADAVASSGAEELLDLYCGAGFFSFGCAAKCQNIKRIYGVEIEEASIECAKFNLKDFENIEIDGYGRTYAEIVVRAKNSYGAYVPSRYAAGFYDVTDSAPCTIIPRSLAMLPGVMVGAQRKVVKTMIKFGTPR
jgi:tRNA/tmRNA/rRNA uracil-C5-methylase (TrmA/RlmC/RlmD family)